MNVALLITQGVLTLVYLFTGGAKLAGADQMKEDFRRFGYSDSFRLFTGVVEVSAAGLLAAGFVWTGVAGLGAALIAAVMGGAVATHWHVGDALAKMLPALVLGALAAWLAITYLGMG
jgi:hypothetical protein